MDGDTGAAAAPAAAPSNGDVPPAPVPAAPPVEEETKGDGRAAEEVEEKMEEGEEEPAAATKATTTNAPPAPPPEAPAPARSGPFSSTVIPRTVDAIAEDHFKRRSAILRALTDGEEKKKKKKKKKKKMKIEIHCCFPSSLFHPSRQPVPRARIGLIPIRDGQESSFVIADARNRARRGR